VRSSLGLASLVSITLVVTAGCSPTTIATRALKEVQGATSKAQPVPGTSARGFGQYQGVDIKSPRSDLGSLVDRRFNASLPAELRRHLTTEKGAPFAGGSPVLTIEPEIIWYHEAGGLGGILGSDSYAVGLFWLSAADAPLGKVQVVTRSAATRTGPEDMAKSMAKELAEFFEKGSKR